MPCIWAYFYHFFFFRGIFMTNQCFWCVSEQIRNARLARHNEALLNHLGLAISPMYTKNEWIDDGRHWGDGDHIWHTHVNGCAWRHRLLFSFIPVHGESLLSVGIRSFAGTLVWPFRGNMRDRTANDWHGILATAANWEIWLNITMSKRVFFMTKIWFNLPNGNFATTTTKRHIRMMQRHS